MDAFPKRCHGFGSFNSFEHLLISLRVLHNDLGPAVHRKHDRTFAPLHFLQVLWEAILKRRRGDATAFRWETFHEEDLSQAELLMKTEWSESTTSKLVVGILVFSRFLAARGVCRPLYYAPLTPRVEDFNRHTIEGREARRDRLPTDAALRGLADIYRSMRPSRAIGYARRRLHFLLLPVSGLESC